MPMTDKKLRGALLECEAIITRAAGEEGITMAIRDQVAETSARRLSHLLWMARTSLELLHEGRREKAMRWLGFLQGALWSLKLAKIEQFKDMNRPDDAEAGQERN